MNLDFHRVAVVNRGEPAMRFLHAARELNEECPRGIHTIILYTEPDKRSRFVRLADEAICLGSATFTDPRDGQRKSKYLDYSALKHALLATRAEAVWVGWGFVAEHADFADLCQELGIVFIGPSGEVMRRVGDKIASKRLAEGANVPVAPWSGGPVGNLEEAGAHADRLGFPLMIKASAGGGGRGVRRITSPDQLREAFASARSEALKFFGDDTVFLEKAIAPARHVEVQVLADHHGSCWPVGVRDCTIQRRNQKVLEEAPSPVLDPTLEHDIKLAAVRVSKAASYVNAGTVEFLLDAKGRTFYFMEMNTRLQVEHPVTEATTGLDLVKMQLHVASGGRLEGGPPRTTGHAIEVRLNAEDAENLFAPAPGTIELFQLPTGPGIRVDTGVRAGDVVAPDFDSMIAKFIAYGKDRTEALARLRRALDESAIVIRGGTSNRGFLLELLAHPNVVASDLDIGWLDRTWGKEWSASRAHADIALIQAALDVYDAEFSIEQRNFFVSASRGRPVMRTDIGRAVELRYGTQTYRLDTRRIGPNEYRVVADGVQIDASVEHEGQCERWLTCRNIRYRVVSVINGTSHLVEIDGIPHRISRDDGGMVRAVSPAVVLAIRTKPGDLVAPGDPLIVLEAMKMETVVSAPCQGRIRKILARPNVQVAAGAPLLVIEPTDDADATPSVPRISFDAASQGRPRSAHGTVSHETGRPATPDPSRPSIPDSTRLVVSQSTGAAPRDYLKALDDVRRLMLGYDVDNKDCARIRQIWTSSRAARPSEDDEAWNAEFKAVAIFSDLLALYDDRPLGGAELRVSGQSNMYEYLRSVHSSGKNLPAQFLDNLKRALAHYGISSLDPSPELDEALVHAHKANQRVDDCAVHALSVLEHWGEHAEGLVSRATPELREMVDRLIGVTQDRYLVVHDLARRVRFRFFEQPASEAGREEGSRRLHDLARQIVEQPEGEERALAVESLVASPYPLQGILASAVSNGNSLLRNLMIEAIFKRFWCTRQLSKVCVEECGAHSVLTAAYTDGSDTAYVVATNSPYLDVSEAALAASAALARVPEAHNASLELYIPYDQCNLDVEQARKDIVAGLCRAKIKRPVSCVCIVLLGIGRSKPVRCFTFLPSETGGYREHDVHPGMHPMMAERFEVWRLSNFRLKQLPAPEHIYLFHGIACANSRDERLFAFVDVHNVQPERDSNGQVISLPHMEYLFLEAVAVMREFQARRSARERLYWNRIVLFLSSLIELTPAEVTRVAGRLAPAAKNLGIEKTVVRARVPNEDGLGFEDRVLHVSNRTGTGIRIQFERMTDRPVRPLTTYAQKVIQLRRLSLLYPYDILRMLTPSKAGEQGEFPPGEFTEYDLDDAGKLVSVSRNPGENRANVVVGVLRNFTFKHPEGMMRVIVLSDPSREMGALAEPECRRIVAAFDLAESLSVPVEWFPVSSGAKIAMNVGTEGLDWVARVLRRIIEFTQKGGEVNVVVTGVNVGGQSYFNAEATMLMHTKGILVMTPQGSMVLTGKRALDYSGGVSADTNQGIGGGERIMGPNGQAQYWARDIAEACHILFRHYEHAYVAPRERFPRRARTSDPSDRDIRTDSHVAGDATSFERVGDVFSMEKNPGRKKPFDIRSVMRAVVDRDHPPLERWIMMRDAETAVTWDAHLGGIPVCLIGIESKPLSRFGIGPADGPEVWTGGTLFPQSSKKIARAINAASGNRPVLVLANLSGFDGSPESMCKLQLEYGAEIGRAVVNFDGPMVFAVISRYHGGAYVVFSRVLNENLHVIAVDGSHASVIGGAPAAAVVFPAEVKARTIADARVKELEKELAAAADDHDRPRILVRYDTTFKQVYSEKQREVAEEFDRVHSVQRALDVGSLQGVVPAGELRGYLVKAVEQGIAKTTERIENGAR